MDSNIIKLTLYLNVQLQAQLIKYLGHLFPVLMLTSNTVSNHKVIILICKMHFHTYPEGFQTVGFKQILDICFSPGLCEFHAHILCVLVLYRYRISNRKQQIIGEFCDNRYR